MLSSLLAACAPASRVDRASPLDAGDGGAGGQGGEGGGGGEVGRDGGERRDGSSGSGGGGSGGRAADAGGDRADASGNGGTGGRGGTGGGSGGTGGMGGMAATGGTGGTAASGGGQDAGAVAPAAPTGLTATAGNAQVSLAWSPASRATSYNVKRSTAAGGPFVVVVSAIMATRHLDDGLTNGTGYYYVVSGNNGTVEGPSSAVASATPVAPPSWSGRDIGAVGVAGSWRQSGGTYTVAGAGDDIYGSADAFHFVYESVSGDATITARVASLEVVQVWSKAAVMMRDGFAAGARNVTVLTSPTEANGYRLQARTATDATTTSERETTGTTPIWVRLVRRGNTFTGWTSPNGASWSQLGATKTIAMPATILVGLAVTSHTTAETTTATFDNVSLTKP